MLKVKKKLLVLDVCIYKNNRFYHYEVYADKNEPLEIEYIKTLMFQQHKNITSYDIIAWSFVTEVIADDKSESDRTIIEQTSSSKDFKKNINDVDDEDEDNSLEEMYNHWKTRTSSLQTSLYNSDIRLTTLDSDKNLLYTMLQ